MEVQFSIGCTAKPSSQQDRAKNGSARNSVEDGANENEHPENLSQIIRPSYLSLCLQDMRIPHHFCYAIEEHEQHNQGTKDASCPRHFLRGGSRPSGRLHEFFFHNFSVCGLFFIAGFCSDSSTCQHFRLSESYRHCDTLSLPLS